MGKAAASWSIARLGGDRLTDHPLGSDRASVGPTRLTVLVQLWRKTPPDLNRSLARFSLNTRKTESAPLLGKIALPFVTLLFKIDL